MRTNLKNVILAGVGLVAVAALVLGIYVFRAGTSVIRGAPGPAPDVQTIQARAATGNAAAQNALGDLYAKGEGFPQNYDEALKWYRSAAEKEFAEAQYNLGVLYETGLSVTRDEAEAAKWHRKAAEQGHTGAAYNLAALYATGRGVLRDAAEAAKWYRQAAEQGDSLAQYNLAWRYEVGKGVSVDRPEAYKWHKLAARQGIADAAQALEDLKKQMTREEITEGQRRVATFIVRKPDSTSSK